MEGQITQRGRRGKMDMVDGEYVEVRSIMKMGSSSVIVLPKLWIQLVSAKGELKGIALAVNEDAIVVRPYYGEVA